MHPRLQRDEFGIHIPADNHSHGRSASLPTGGYRLAGRCHSARGRFWESRSKRGRVGDVMPRLVSRFGSCQVRRCDKFSGGKMYKGW